MSVLTHNMTIAGSSVEQVPISGNFFDVFDAELGFEVSFDGSSWFPMRKYDVWSEPFTSFYVRNASVDPLVIVFRYGDKAIDSKANAVVFAGTQPVNIENWPVDPIAGTFVPEVFDTLTSVADVAVGAGLTVTVSAAAATKRETIIRNPSSSGITVRVGGVGTAAAAGISLEPGENITVTGSGAVLVHNLGGSVVNIQVLQVSKV